MLFQKQIEILDHRPSELKHVDNSPPASPLATLKLFASLKISCVIKQDVIQVSELCLNSKKIAGCAPKSRSKWIKISEVIQLR